MNRWLCAGAFGTAMLLAQGAQAGLTADGKWRVERGDSVYKITRTLAPDSAKQRKQLAKALVAANPKAFKDGNPNWLFAGVTLRIPDAAAVAALLAGQRQAAAREAAKAAAPVEPEDDSAGKVVYTKGSATAAGGDGGIRSLQPDSKVFEGDTVSTGPGSYIRLRYKDGATMLLRPRTRMQIEEYRHTGDTASDSSLLNLVKGGFRTVTGAIGRENRSNYKVRTPVATIGIRGTDYSAIFCQGDCVNLPDGLYTAVEAGGTTVSASGGGVQDVAPGQSAFVPITGGAPQLLRVKPAMLDLPTPACE